MPQRDASGRFVSAGTPPGPSGSPFSQGSGNIITIHVANEALLMGRFKQHKAGLVVQVERIAEDLARRIADMARDLVAVDTGATKQSIRVQRESYGYVVVVDRGGDRPEVPIYLEIGTYKMAARPFLKPATDIVLAAGGMTRSVASVGGLLAPTAALGFGR